MARVAVIHNTLDLHGGADAVCLHVCEALQHSHDVTLFTLSRTSLEELNALFDTDAQVMVHRPPGTRSLAHALDALAGHIGPQLAARSVLLDRIFERHAADFDVAVSTANEFALSIPSVQYVHFPQFNLAYTATDDAERGNALWSRLSGLGDRILPDNATMLANSSWTADVVADVYDRRPDTLAPPVDPIPGARPWAERENAVVVLGRLAPDKRTQRAIDIVDGVRERGHDLHLHLVGSAPPAYHEYASRLESMATAREYVHVERDVSRARVETLLTTHKYGLNTKPKEHFGMALAECVAAGMVAFAPNSGGQRDVLAGADDRLYDSTGDAIEKLAAAVHADSPPTLDRDRFESERFHDAIRARVAAQC